MIGKGEEKVKEMVNYKVSEARMKVVEDGKRLK
jgi:hypothetical protein